MVLEEVVVAAIAVVVADASPLAAEVRVIEITQILKSFFELKISNFKIVGLATKSQTSIYILIFFFRASRT